MKDDDALPASRNGEGKEKGESLFKTKAEDGGETADGEGRRASQGCGFVSGSGGLGNNGDGDRDPNPNPEQKSQRPEPEPEFVTRKSQAGYFLCLWSISNSRKGQMVLQKMAFCVQPLFLFFCSSDDGL